MNINRATKPAGLLQAHRFFHGAPPGSPLLPWSWPRAPWQCLHVDFATHQAKHYLIMVDAHSKWPGVIGPMTTTADSTINAMRNIFARYGLPTQVVSDNGPPFQSAEYEEFLRKMAFREF